MIRNFRHRGLRRLFSNRDYRGVPAQFADRLERMLDRLDAATNAQDMNLPGYRWHRLKGARKGTCAISVSGNWRITFRFDNEDAVDVDLEDYH